MVRYRYQSAAKKKPCGANAARRNEVTATVRCGLEAAIWG
jgi:hypothetical protein